MFTHKLGLSHALLDASFYTLTNPWLYILLWALCVTSIVYMLVICCQKQRSLSYRSMRARAWINHYLTKGNDRFRRAMIPKPPSLDNTYFKAQTPEALHRNAIRLLTILEPKELPTDARQSLQEIATEMYGDVKYATMFAKHLIQLHPALHEIETVVETINNQDATIFEQVTRQYRLIDRLIIASVSHAEGGCHKYCPFHKETLLVHLFSAAYFSMVSAAKTKDVDSYVAFVAALFHDCVKAETNKKHDDEPCPKHGKRMGLSEHEDANAQCKCARYPAHGLLGSMFLSLFAKHIIATMRQRFNTRQALEWFNALLRVVQIHMSLHPYTEKDENNVDTSETSDKTREAEAKKAEEKRLEAEAKKAEEKRLKAEAEAFRIRQVLTPESYKVKLLSVHMFAGDNLGKLPHPSFESDKPFEEKYLEFWYNVKCMTKEALPLQTLNPEAKIIITPCGQSGHGKTTFIERLMKMLSTKHHAIHISRDACICEVMTGTNTRLVGKEYAEMYTAYNSVRRFHAEQISFEELSQILSDNKNLSPKFNDLKENVPDVDKEVTKLFADQINKALNDPLISIIIVDTLMNLWKNESAKLPYFTGEHIQIDVPVCNFSKVVSTNNGLDLQTQLRLSKSNSLTRPADGEFTNGFFKSVLQTPENRKYQAPPVMLSDSNGVPCEVGWNNSLGWLLNAIGKSPIVSKYVDANIMNLNGKQFMEHLVKKYKGNLFEIRKRLFDHWDVNMNGILPIGKDMKLSVEAKARYITALVEFTTHLHSFGILSKPITKQEFERDEKLFWNTIFCIPTLKYKDTFSGEKFWINLFMLKFRGLNLFIHPITGEVMDLRFLMDRGAEIHSKITKAAKVKGQDDDDTNHGINLNKIKDALLKDLPIHGYLTQKADGSLASFTVYTGKALKVMHAYVQTFGTEVAKEIARKSMEMSNGEYLVILATQGTKSITEDMVPFATTSIFGGIYENGRPFLSREDFGDKTPLMLWKEHGEKVLQRVYALHASAYAKHKDESISLMFEMVCANRRDAFGGKAHEEFACQSTRDQFLFLGFGYSCEETIPHFAVDIKGLFRQPAFWEINHSSQVNDMIRDLQKVMIYEMTQEQFIMLYPPKNPEEFDSLHPEGFCFWAYVEQSTSLLHSVFGLPGVMTYSKVKTLIYYQGHKVKMENINALVEFGRRVKGLIPKADILFAIYSSGELQTLLRKLHEEFLEMFTIKHPNSELSSIINEIYGHIQQGSAEDVAENVVEGVVEGVDDDEDFEEAPTTQVQKSKKKFVHPFELFAHLEELGRRPKVVQKRKEPKKKADKEEKIKVEMSHLDKFVHALMNHKLATTDKAIRLCQRMEVLIVDRFIQRWNETFSTEIQSLEQIAKLLKDSEQATFSEDGRNQFLDRVRLAKVARSELLIEILDKRPWNFEAWVEIATCTDVPSLLEFELIKLVIKLMNAEQIYIPVVKAQTESASSAQFAEAGCYVLERTPIRCLDCVRKEQQCSSCAADSARL